MEFSINAGVSKIRSLLLARQSGGASCLICLEKVRATDPVWDCKVGCHAIFHLICIQSWARQALNAAALRTLGPLSGQHFPVAQAEAEEKACWHCPKCRCGFPSETSWLHGLHFPFITCAINTLKSSYIYVLP